MYLLTLFFLFEVYYCNSIFHLYFMVITLNYFYVSYVWIFECMVFNNHITYQDLLFNYYSFCFVFFSDYFFISNNMIHNQDIVLIFIKLKNYYWIINFIWNNMASNFQFLLTNQQIYNLFCHNNILNYLLQKHIFFIRFTIIDNIYFYFHQVFKNYSIL